eukprot:m.170955 g.170955  ORF g.170955 m.170955 type:complete len:111 (-) comp10382_c1_seq2:99-431(-)
MNEIPQEFLQPTGDVVFHCPIPAEQRVQARSLSPTNTSPLWLDEDEETIVMLPDSDDYENDDYGLIEDYDDDEYYDDDGCDDFDDYHDRFGGDWDEPDDYDCDDFDEDDY